MKIVIYKCFKQVNDTQSNLHALYSNKYIK